MASLSKETIQKLAVLRTLSLWEKGAYGPVRLHKTLFFADKHASDPKGSIFTFKRWYLGQYSDEIAQALNELQNASKVKMHFDGPSGRLEARVSPNKKKVVVSFFKQHFSAWEKSLRTAFREWAYLSNDEILIKAHDDPTYKTSNHGEVIMESRLADTVTFDALDSETAESLTDLVDDVLAERIRNCLREAQRHPARAENWRSIYFGKQA